MNNHPLDPIRAADPALFELISGSRDLAFAPGELSLKEKLLIAFAIDVAKQAEGGVRSLALQALEAGATKKELCEALDIAHYICGVGCIYTAAAALKEVL